MPTVHIDARQLSGNEELLVGEKGTIDLNPYRAYVVDSGDDDYLVSAEKLSVRLVEGVADVDLPQTPVNNLMKVQLRGIRGYGSPFYVQIPAGDCNLFELTHIDPDTLDPIVEPDAAWTVALEAEETRALAAEADLQEQINADTGAVTSVNAQTGVVVLDQDDIADGTTAKQYTTAEKSKLAAITGTNTGDQDLSALASTSALTTETNARIAADALKANTSSLAAVATSGSASDITTGTLPTSVLPAISITDVFTVASQAAMLALTAEKGDVAIRTDTNTAYMLSTNSPTTLADWKSVTPSGSVTSVNSQQGIVSLAKGDVGLGNVDNTSDAAKPVSSAQATADTAATTAAQATSAQRTSNLSDLTDAGTARTNLGLGTAATQAIAAFDAAGSAAAAQAASQPLDTDLTTIAGLTATTDNVIQSVGSAWASRTPAQVKATLALAKGDVGLGNVDNTADASKPVSTAQASADTAATAAAVATSAQRASNLSDLASAATARTNLGLGNVDNTSNATERAATATLTNKTLTAPVINSPTGIVKGDVGLGNVDNTSNATERAATATLTNKRITKRVSTTADTATLTIASDDYDVAHVTALAQAMTIAAPTGTPTTAQGLVIRIKDNGTARALTWNAAFRAIGATLPTTTVINKTVYVGAMWNVADSKWDVIAVAQEA